MVVTTGPRRRQQGHDALADDSQDAATQSRGPPSRPQQSWLSKNLRWVIAVQLLLVVLLLLDPIGLRHAPAPAAPVSAADSADDGTGSGDASAAEATGSSEPGQIRTQERNAGRNKPSLGIADVESLAAKMAVNGSVILLFCPTGYEEFVKNWLAVASQHQQLGRKFLILAEDEATFNTLADLYPENTIYRMDVKEPFPDHQACKSGNSVALAAMESAYRKVAYARELMNAGHNALLCDVTALWLQYPFSHLKAGLDVYMTLGNTGVRDSGKLLLDFPADAVQRLKEPLPRGVGKLPPVSEEFVFLQNNVGAWVTLDYWAVVLEGMILKECNQSSAATPSEGRDRFLDSAPLAAFQGAIKNAAHLSPRPHMGILPPGKFPPPTVYFEDDSWRSLIQHDVVVLRSKDGATSKEAIKARLQKAGYWKVG